MSEQVICANCGHLGPPRVVTQGSFAIELLLWLCFVIPGLIYSLWRRNTRQDVCAKCLCPNPLPLDTPRGKQLAMTFRQTSAQSEVFEYRGNATRGRVYMAIIALVIATVIYLVMR